MRLNDLDERLFTHGDAVRITGITSKDLNNWTQRGLVDHLGKIERSGRRMYSTNDLIALRVIGGLAQRCAVTPSFAAAMSGLAKAGDNIVVKDPESGSLSADFTAPPAAQTFLIAWIEDDKFKVATVLGGDLLLALAAKPHPVNLVPLDVIASEVVATAIALLGEED